MNNPVPPPATSEVGSNQENERNRGENNSDEQWRGLFEMQNLQMRALIQALKTPSVNSAVNLPKFDPDKPDVDARSWCATADLCFTGNPIEGGQLIMTLSKALKGAASTWLSQITYPGMTWADFKELFTSRFVCVETNAATLINLSNDKPLEKETYGAYASRQITALMSRWKNASIEQVAVSVVLSHLAQFDNRLNRLAFTTEISTRSELQKELQAFSYLKRKSPTVTEASKPVMDNAKRQKFSQPTTVKCFLCGKLGHKQADCRLKGLYPKKQPAPASSQASHQQQPASSRAIICFKCGEPGHIATRCPAPASTPRPERRVDLCVVEPPTGELKHLE
ncbi:uncharacterized protein LOC119693379 [Plutella xylostella]|uniref:uncharacterized protein LOC119693379 n=1 Tax=Plutella xylostella TaxID=51655 RepID=UPI0018D048CB|nr:uncharacterized protein LOC119693379 [Plutella xylostella]